MKHYKSYPRGTPTDDHLKSELRAASSNDSENLWSDRRRKHSARYSIIGDQFETAFKEMKILFTNNIIVIYTTGGTR
jgi:hypothetical protein